MTVLFAFPAMAQLNGTGFYRVRNAQYNEYIKIANDKLHYHKIVDAAPGGTALANNTDNAQARALEFARRILKSDIKMMSTDYIDPTSIIYIKKLVNSSSDYTYDLQGQGTGLLTLTTGIYDGSSDITFKDIAATIKPVSGSNTYTASIELKGSITILFWTQEATLGVRYFMDDNGTFDIDEASTNLYDRWYIEPVTYFNVEPEVEFNGKYYTTIKVPFAFKLSNNVEKAYAITANNSGVLDYAEVATTGGTVPAGTPVVLECTSPNAADCQLIPTGTPKCAAQTPSTETAPSADQSSSYTGTNLLDGTYFANNDGTLSYSGSYSEGTFSASYNVDNYVENTNNAKKYVLGITDSGKLGFVYDANISMMPVNKAWLTAAGEFPWELPKADADLSYATAEYTVYVGQSFTAPTVTNPNNLTGITYSSSNAAAATVDAATGAVTIGNTAGDAVITANFAGNDQYYEGSASYTIHVLAKTTPELSFTPTTATAVAGATEFTPPTLNNPTGVTVTYSSSNENVALVDETTGYVVIGNAGTAVITATFAGSTEYNGTSASYTITVTKKAAGLAYATAEYTVYVGQNFETPTLTNPNNLPVTYSSSNEDLALVDENTGEVAIGDDAGDVTITASFAGNGVYEAGSANYIIHILAKTTPALSFTPTTATAVAGAEEFTPPTLNNPAGLTVTYSSSDDEVALVDENTGYVVIGNAGTAVITATFAGNTQYNATSASYTITVTKAPHGLAWSTSQYEYYYLVSNEDPTEPELVNPNNLPVTYSSSDETVATVNAETGELTLVGPGNCYIEVKTDGDASHVAGSKDYHVFVQADPAIYRLVTDDTKLKAGDELIIVGINGENAVAMGTSSYYNNTYFSRAVTIENNKINTDYGTQTNDIWRMPQVFTLEAPTREASTWLIRKINSSYLTNDATSFGGVGILNTDLENAPTVAISIENEEATIQFSNTSRVIRMTADNQYFGCYTAEDGSVLPVRLFKKVNQVDPELAFADDMPTTVYAGSELDLVVNKPEGVDVTFTSSNPEVATVDENGTVTFLQSGEVTITATSVETDEYSVGTATLTITVENGLRGDVNDDKKVDITDATMLINYLLSNDPTGINMANANCDLEGGVDISDATALINYLLSNAW